MPVVLIEEHDHDEDVGEAISNALKKAGFSDVIVRHAPRRVSGFADREEPLRLAEKMESIARLAGGIAHDFNNILSVISICADEVLEGLTPGAAERECVLDIRHAVDRGATITRDLLAFSRRDVNEPRIIDFNELIEDCRPAITRVVGDTIQIDARLEAIEATVRIDPLQWSSVFVNLSINARAAMSVGGTIGFHTRTVTIDPRTRGVERPAGQYLQLMVSDTGEGIAPELLGRIFDPFFTTRGVGKGSGLGLSVVHGIVEQASGFIEVVSELGRGTTFTIHLPITDGPVASEARPMTNGAFDTVVLLVEDERTMRRVAKRTLERQGYTVLEAESAESALELLAGAPKIDLLVTDVLLPKMNGRQLADAVVERHPSVRVLYTSGYTDDVDLGDSPYLQKPYTTRVLLRRVEELLTR